MRAEFAGLNRPAQLLRQASNKLLVKRHRDFRARSAAVGRPVSFPGAGEQSKLAALITMYSDRELILSKKLSICPPGKDAKGSSEWIDNFLPPDLEGQKYTCDLELLAKAKGFCFAGMAVETSTGFLSTTLGSPTPPSFSPATTPWAMKK